MNEETDSKREGAELPTPICSQWWVCDLDKYGMFDWKNADGPHDDIKGCQKTIALFNRLACIEKKPRVICEVRFYKPSETLDGVNQSAIDMLNSIVANTD
ncbi:MAG: hypothetical protein ABQ298_03700 [Puniceicoccaceae bacterium]